MAKFSESQARDIGSKFGSSTEDFSKASENTIESVTMAWCNDGMEIMGNVIRKKARTKGASTLAQDMKVQPAKKQDNGISIDTTTDQEYFDFVDKGVRGVKGNKAPNSPYRFKNLGVSKKMVESFKQYIARTGTKSFGGKKLIQKNKKKQDDDITRAAKQMAVATKIGGIKPMNFIKPAVTPERKKALANAIMKSVSQVIKINIATAAK